MLEVPPAREPEGSVGAPTPGHSEDGEAFGPIPNHETIAHEPGADPLREPTRPVRARTQTVRFEPGGFAMAALNGGGAEAASHGFDAKSPRLAMELLTVDVNFVAQLLEAEERCAFEQLPSAAQRSLALAADYATSWNTWGPHSPQTQMIREVYASSMVAGAALGWTIPPLEAAYSSVSRADAAMLDRGQLFERQCEGDIWFSNGWDGILAGASKTKTSPDDFNERQMRGVEWDTPKQAEIAKIGNLKAKVDIAADDPLIKGMPICDTMWTGRRKREGSGEVKKLNARCVVRGDLQKKFYHLTSNHTFSPTIRNTSLLCIEARACALLMHMCTFDVPGAYLQGVQRKAEQMVLRPPLGFRKYDERGVEILWLMHSPLYGQGDAGAIWNRTINSFLVEELGFERSSHDPCIYTRLDGQVILPLYVDDGRIYYAPTDAARREAQ